VFSHLACLTRVAVWVADQIKMIKDEFSVGSASLKGLRQSTQARKRPRLSRNTRPATPATTATPATPARGRGVHRHTHTRTHTHTHTEVGHPAPCATLAHIGRRCLNHCSGNSQRLCVLEADLHLDGMETPVGLGVEQQILTHASKQRTSIQPAGAALARLS
jgi:hypothetical protein